MKKTGNVKHPYVVFWLSEGIMVYFWTSVSLMGSKWPTIPIISDNDGQFSLMDEVDAYTVMMANGLFGMYVSLTTCHLHV